MQYNFTVFTKIGSGSIYEILGISESDVWPKTRWIWRDFRYRLPYKIEQPDPSKRIVVRA